MSERLAKQFVDGKRLHRATPELIKPIIENVAKFSMPFLLEGRKEKYDVFHSFNVDYFVTQIARTEGLDELVLRTAAWLHDTGNSRDQNNHIEHSLQISHSFLEDNKENYTPDQVEQILNIINVHNSPELIISPLEIAFMEADVLSAITTDRNKFRNFQHGASYVENVLIIELDKFKTKRGKKLLSRYFPIFLKELHQLPKNIN